MPLLYGVHKCQFNRLQMCNWSKITSFSTYGFQRGIFDTQITTCMTFHLIENNYGINKTIFYIVYAFDSYEYTRDTIIHIQSLFVNPTFILFINIFFYRWHSLSAAMVLMILC